MSDLVEGFESSFGLELLATVHWVAAEHPLATDEGVIAYTYGWGPHKRQFSERQIKLALQVLRDKAWLQSRPISDPKPTPKLPEPVQAQLWPLPDDP